MTFVTINNRSINAQLVVSVKDVINPYFFSDLRSFATRKMESTVLMWGSPEISEDLRPSIDDYPKGVEVQLVNGDTFFVENTTVQEMEAKLNGRG